MWSDLGSDMGSPRERFRDQRREISQMKDIQALASKEDMLRRRMSSRLTSMNQTIDRAAKDDMRSLSALRRSEQIRTKKPPGSRSLSVPSLNANSLSRSSHAEQKQGLQELEELDVLMFTLERRKIELQEQERQKHLLRPVQAVGCAKARSVTSFDQWFKNHGRPSGASKWENWSSSCPDIRKTLGRH
mmetsp:Transcript_100826/g.325101  ORF Transcript_100826/g.325101 Transcript_100826/m.325101 type:complete len:188 (-) Transcript_100826:128-691(-)